MKRRCKQCGNEFVQATDEVWAHKYTVGSVPCTRQPGDTFVKATNMGDYIRVDVPGDQTYTTNTPDGPVTLLPGSYRISQGFMPKVIGGEGAIKLPTGQIIDPGQQVSSLDTFAYHIEQKHEEYVAAEEVEEPGLGGMLEKLNALKKKWLATPGLMKPKEKK